MGGWPEDALSEIAGLEGDRFPEAAPGGAGGGAGIPPVDSLVADGGGADGVVARTGRLPQPAKKTTIPNAAQAKPARI